MPSLTPCAYWLEYRVHILKSSLPANHLYVKEVFKNNMLNCTQFCAIYLSSCSAVLFYNLKSSDPT